MVLRYLLSKDSINDTYYTVETNIPIKTCSKFFIMPEHGCYRSLRPFRVNMGPLHGNHDEPGSAKPVVSSRIWSKAPFRCIRFSMAATPLSLMLQQRQPFANSRNSSELSAVGSSGEDTLIALADEVRFNKKRDSVVAMSAPSMS